MSSSNIRDEGKNNKTENALYAAMFSLLKKSSFRKITVRGICEEALISRAAFYAHFVDKYDLLRRWLDELWPKDAADNYTYEQVEKAVNQCIAANMAILKNLVYDADDETFEVIFDFLLSTINLNIGKNRAEANPQNIVMANFYAGGIISYFLWLIKNKFPQDVPPMNRYFYEMLRDIQSSLPNQG